MCVDENLRKTIEETREDSLYSVGAWDAVARLLAVIARQQGADLDDDISGVANMVDIYHSEHEGSRKEGFGNVVGVFRDEFYRK